MAQIGDVFLLDVRHICLLLELFQGHYVRIVVFDILAVEDSDQLFRNALVFRF